MDPSLQVMTHQYDVKASLSSFGMLTWQILQCSSEDVVSASNWEPQAVQIGSHSSLADIPLIVFNFIRNKSEPMN